MFLDNLVLGAGATGMNLGDIVVTLVTFLLLMALLKKFAWGPLMGIMQQREELVASEIEEAEKNRKESANLLAQNEKLVKETQANMAEILESAKKQATAQREEIISAATAEAARLKESAQRDIVAEREKAVEAIREEVVSLSVLAASKVLGKEISEADNSALIKETIAKAGEIK
ncbi:F0F1 ATP synthase subunit B [Caryophanon latum]|uniref:ATP synthase subunit b n=1 Tax=Caryophanon latum TaxID=33977 RepID=A0A1C0YDK1_9BACL|nr:F0F1 ATP synthase subunit B [Caryophanon latum]OCS85258.1 ATP synthase F0 subunit B [Caryophanon latum]